MNVMINLNRHGVVSRITLGEQKVYSKGMKPEDKAACTGLLRQTFKLGEKPMALSDVLSKIVALKGGEGENVDGTSYLWRPVPADASKKDDLTKYVG